MKYQSLGGAAIFKPLLRVADVRASPCYEKLPILLAEFILGQIGLQLPPQVSLQESWSFLPSTGHSASRSWGNPGGLVL